jgi:CO dehydrogenase nickel-insertion accessory protein CooC1
MPFWLKHFGNSADGAGEAYHIGVFGKTGSGKSGLAAYVLLGYARHKNMGILFVDPQGQFTSGKDLPFDLHFRLKAVQIGLLTTRESLAASEAQGSTFTTS